jgi:hypothetical protein
MVLVERPPGSEPLPDQRGEQELVEKSPAAKPASHPSSGSSDTVDPGEARSARRSEHRSPDSKPAARRDSHRPLVIPSTDSQPPSGGLLEGDMDDLLAGKPRRENDPDAETVADPLLADALPNTSSARTSRPARNDVDDHQEDLESDVPHPADWQSDESRQLRQWGFIGGMGVAAVITIIVLIGFAITRRPRLPDPLAHENAVGATSPVAAGDSPSSAASDEVAPTSSADSRDAAFVDAEASRDVEPLGDDSSVASSTRDASAASDRLPPDEAADTNPDDHDLSHRPRVAEQEPVTEADSEVRGTGDEEASSAVGSRALRLFPGLRDFDDLFSDQPLDSSLILADSPFDLIPRPGIPHDLSLAMPKPAPRQVNVTSQLGVRIPEIEFTEMPLWAFLRFFSEFTTIPITLDIDALQRMRLSPGTPVSLRMSNAEVGEILRSGLEPLALRFRTLDSQLVVDEQDGDVAREQTYEVHDLTGDQPEAAAVLEALLTAMVAPGTWQTRGGAGKLAVREGRLAVTHSSAVHAEIWKFCQALRQARGLPPQGDRDAADGTWELRFAGALPKLAQPVTAPFAIPTALVEVLDHLAAEADMTFVVDWRSLIAAGWNQDSLARLEVDDEPLSTVLQDLLGPMQLSFRVIDDRTLQITTASVAFETLEFGFFPLGDLMDKEIGQQILEGVREALGDVLSLERAGGGTRFDNPSRTLVVRAGQHQLAAVARRLEQLRLQAR